MKSSKSFIIASFFALAIVHVASAQTTVRITGSTAFRAATHQAILHIIQPATLNFGYTGTSYNGATEAIITGTTTAAAGSLPVVIKTAWSGSVGGVFTLVTNGPVPNASANPPITAGWLVNSTPTSPGGTPNAPANFDAPVTADVAMSDSFQGSTPYTTLALTDHIVGVVPFVWVRNAGAPTTLTNMTQQLAKAVLNNPGLPLSEWTATATDTILVFATGRNNDSGTRLDAFAESGFGVGGAPVQVDGTQSSTSGFAWINAGVWTAGSGGVGNVAFFAAPNGYSSGGSLATEMNATNSNNVLPGWLVTYLGINDAGSVNGGANALTYNGVPYLISNVQQTANVQQGLYSFWSYEHLFYRTAGTLANVVTIANGLAAQIRNTDAATSGILATSMAVQRASEGAPIVPGQL